MNTDPTRPTPAVFTGLTVNPSVVAGELVRYQRPRVLDAVIVPVHPQLRRPPWRRVRPWLTVLAGLVAAAVFAGVVWLLVAQLLVLVALVMAWVQAHWVWLLLAAGLLLLLLTRVGGQPSCAGLHCGGCRR